MFFIAALLFACGILLGLVLQKRLSSSVEAVQEAEHPRNAAEEDAFRPQLINLQSAIGPSRAMGKAYGAARKAGILR